MFGLNSKVRITNPKNKSYGRVGEIVGYAEDLLGRGIYYTVEFAEEDELIGLFLDEEVELTGEKGNRRILKNVNVHADGLMFTVRDTYILDYLKPTCSVEDNTFIVSIPETYEIGHIVDFIREVKTSCKEFKTSKNLIIDFSDYKNEGYLGMGDEIVTLIQEFEKSGDSEGVFVINNKHLSSILEMLIGNKYPKVFTALEEAKEYFANKNSDNFVKYLKRRLKESTDAKSRIVWASCIIRIQGVNDEMRDIALDSLKNLDKWCLVTLFHHLVTFKDPRINRLIEKYHDDEDPAIAMAAGSALGRETRRRLQPSRPWWKFW